MIPDKGTVFLLTVLFSAVCLGSEFLGPDLNLEESISKFDSLVDLDRIYNKGGKIYGFEDAPLVITGDPNIILKLNRGSQPYARLALGNNGIILKNMSNFEVKSSNKEIIFDIHRPTYNVRKTVDNLQSLAISSREIISPINKSLAVESGKDINLKGSEGIYIQGLNDLFSANHSFVVNSTRAVILHADISFNKIGIASHVQKHRNPIEQYKICVCMPSGILFRLVTPGYHSGIKMSCAHFSSKIDPCNISM